MKPIIIGLSGKRGSGKDTLGAAIAAFGQKDGYLIVRRAFGDSLKEEAARALSATPYLEVYHFLHSTTTPEWAEKILEQTYPKDAPTSNLLGKYDEILQAMHDPEQKERYRFLLQWWGTEYRRVQFKDDYWLDQWQKWINRILQESNDDVKLLIFVPDLRFTNEQAFLEEIGAFTVRVNRPSVDTGDTHISEVALDGYKNFHMTVLNEDSLQMLKNVGYQAFGAASTYTYGSAPL